MSNIRKIVTMALVAAALDVAWVAMGGNGFTAGASQDDSMAEFAVVSRVSVGTAYRHVLVHGRLPEGIRVGARFGGIHGTPLASAATTVPGLE